MTVAFGAAALPLEAPLDFLDLGVKKSEMGEVAETALGRFLDFWGVFTGEDEAEEGSGRSSGTSGSGKEGSLRCRPEVGGDPELDEMSSAVRSMVEGPASDDVSRGA